MRGKPTWRIRDPALLKKAQDQGRKKETLKAKKEKIARSPGLSAGALIASIERQLEK